MCVYEFVCVGLLFPCVGAGGFFFGRGIYLNKRYIFNIVLLIESFKMKRINVLFYWFDFVLEFKLTSNEQLTVVCDSVTRRSKSIF